MAATVSRGNQAFRLTPRLSTRRQRLNKIEGLSQGAIVVGILIIGLLVYLIVQNRQAGTYKNVETWKVKWDKETMLPLEVEVNRDAKRK